MIGYILVGILLWASKFIPRKQVSRETEILFAFLSPAILLGVAFIWNVWARNLIGWPEIKTYPEFLLTVIF